jgi:hypothetical protein
MSELKSLVNATIENVKPELHDRPAITAYVVAKTLGHVFSLPSSAVENPYKFFRDTHIMNLHKHVSEVNEEIVVDVDEVESLILKIWIMRYRLVFEVNHPSVKDYIAALIKIGAADVPKPYTELMRKYKELCSGYDESYQVEE